MNKRKNTNSPATGREGKRPRKPVRARAKPFLIAGVGASAGGLEAFTWLLQNLPADTGMAFVLVQHLDPERSSALAQILSKAASIPVQEATHNQRVEPNHVYVIPPNAKLAVSEGVLKLRPRGRAEGAHRLIDFFFESLARDQSQRAVGVILSGAASDGTIGLEAIKAEGGITFAQDESAKYDSMPRSAVSAGCVDFVLPPEKIAAELARIARHPLGAAGEAGLGAEPRAPARRGAVSVEGKSGPPVVSGESGLVTILGLLHRHYGVDFSLYKSSTIERRITRRMVLSKLETLEAYAELLGGNAREIEALCSDVLINVTSFFRDPEVFEALKRRVFPGLLEERREGPVRCWVPGCSSGQEAYSLVMAFMEFSDRLPRAPKLQVFATDLNESLLTKARAGFYAKSLVQDVSPERLRRFFAEQEGGYRVIKPLREAVVFARQNFLSDPPFSRMDVVSCRNLLIYIESGSQKKVMPTFHYALRPGGFLLLGAAEGVGGFTGLFEPVDKKRKIFSRKPVPTPPLQARIQESRGPAGRGNRAEKPGGAPLDAPPAENNAQREADRVTRNRYAPPAVLVNAEWQVLQFRGETGAYLKPPRGEATFNVLKMAREGLLLPLRAALNEAKKGDRAARRENVRVSQNGGSRATNVEVVPLKNLQEPCFLVSFESAAAGRGASSPRRATAAADAPPEQPPASGAAEESRRNAELELELAETRDYLQSLQEQSEAAHEELQASNEEATSANEELQSINEELETSKEEIESANEELSTLNDEMADRNAELNRLNSDLVNLQSSTHLAILLLGRDLTIRRFTPQAEKQFNLLATDVGRPIGKVQHNLDLPDLEAFTSEVIASLRERELETRDKKGRWFSLRARPYMTLDNKIDGAVLVLVDIDALKRAEQGIAAARAYAENIVESVREPLLVLDACLRVESANQSYYQTFRVSPEETMGRFIYDLGRREWNAPRLREMLEEILPQHRSMEQFEVRQDFERLGPRVMLLNARRIDDPTWRNHRILLAIQDVTESRRQQEAVERARIAEAVIRSARDPLVILDAEFHVRSASEAFSQVFNLPAPQCLGRSIFELSGRQWNIPKLRLLLEDVIRRNSFFNEFEAALESARSGRRTFLLDGRVLHGGDNGPARILLSMQDITEVLQFQNDLRRSEARKSAILKSAPDAVITMDREGKILEFNPAAERIFGHPQAAAAGRPLVELLFPAAGDPARELAQALAAGEGPALNRQIELTARRADGAEFEAELAVISVAAANPPIFTAFARDISGRKRAEKA